MGKGLKSYACARRARRACLCVLARIRIAVFFCIPGLNCEYEFINPFPDPGNAHGRAIRPSGPHEPARARRGAPLHTEVPRRVTEVGRG